MATEYENHEGVKIPVGSAYPDGKSTITPSQDRWAGTRDPKATKNGNGNGGKKK